MGFPSLFNSDETEAVQSQESVSGPSGTASERPGHTQSLYRKYRPQSFDAIELVGQQHVVQTLRNAILLDRVAHAYLFSGPRGTGKTTTARLLAKAVNCLDPDPLQRPCNACVNCQAINAGSATDVIEIDAASNRGIDDIRELRERVKYAPTQLKTKFYIIDEAHQITGAAANAFLKTLEEPPVHTKFILATTDPEELLQTIVSRCQRFDFRRIGVEAIIQRLRTVAEAEGLQIDDEALLVIARHATGSLRDALGLLDQLSVYRESEQGDQGTSIDASAVRSILGVSRNDRVEGLVKALADRDATAALETVNRAVEAGEDARQLNRQLVGFLRVLLHQRAGGSPDADESAKALAERFELLELAQLARQFSEIDFRIRHSTYSQLPLEVALVEAILHQSPVGDSLPSAVQTPTGSRERAARTIHEEPITTDIPTTRLRDKVRGNSTAPASVKEVKPAVVSSDAILSNGVANGQDLTVAQLADLWERVRADVKAVNRRVEALLSTIDPVAVNGDEITLASPYEFHKNKMNGDDARKVVEDVITRLTGRGVRVSCVLRDEVARPRRESPTPSSRPIRSQSTSNEPDADDDDDIDTVIASPTELRREDEATQQRINAAKNIFDAEEVRD
jgi:DNA polymerase III subunit gamma/tau